MLNALLYKKFLEGHIKKFGRWWMFITLIVVMVSECEYVQDHQVLYVKSMQFFLCHLYINKADKKQIQIKLRGI